MAVILFRIIMLLSLYQKWTAPAIKDPAASNEVFDSRGSRQISMQAWIPGSLLAGIKVCRPASLVLKEPLTAACTLFMYCYTQCRN